MCLTRVTVWVCYRRIRHSPQCATQAERALLFVAGRYCKLSRETSHTRLTWDGKRLVATALDDFILEPVRRLFAADAAIFTSAGREDVDVRMLGRGRPFVVQIVNPRPLSCSREALAAAEAEINDSGPAL